MPKDLVIVLLAVSLAMSLFASVTLHKEARRAAYLEGRQSVFEEFAAAPDDGTCYAKNRKC